MRLKTVVPALACAAALGTAVAGGTAAAAPAPARPAAVAPVAAPATCVYAEAKESVKIRNARKVNATALGLFPKGSLACRTSTPTTSGESYNLCGVKDNAWSEITYRGIRGWIPRGCTVNRA
ncbi:hypothetical protein [Streptomyces sp. S186]|uniref:hypothetical protein n=1 Tax=Streptomyces sp. S186 TaxID=3434395 RepID=UPI003F66B1D2